MASSQFTVGLPPNGSGQHQLHYTTLPRNTHMTKTSGRVMRLPLENGGGHDKMLATIVRNNPNGGPPNGMKVTDEVFGIFF